MLRTSTRSLFLLVLVAGTLRAADTVPLFGVFETAITNEHAYDNKFRDVDLLATFVAPGGRTVPFWGFFDGDGTGLADRFDPTDPDLDHAGMLSGTTWRLRFMPDEVGTWTYTWRFSDDRASGSGSFDCVDPVDNHRRGVLREHDTNPHWLMDGRDEGFFPKFFYQRDSNRAHYYHIDDYQANWDLFIDNGFNMLGFNWMSVWPEIINPNPDNGPHDANVYLWRHVKPIDTSDSQNRTQVAADRFDTERINIFAIRRIEQHIRYLASRGVYTWGFQGFNCKRSVNIYPHSFPDEKYAWYIRYCMARLAPFYNVVWNNTWESSNGGEDFKRLTQEDGYDPWRHLFISLGKSYGYADVDASDWRIEYGVTLRQTAPDPVTRPLWSMESNGLWSNKNASAGFLIYKYHAIGISPTWLEWNLGDPVPRWDQYFTTEASVTVPAAFATLEEQLVIPRMRPHQELVSNGAYVGCLAEPGEQYLVAADIDGDFTLQLPTGRYSALWVDWRSDDKRGPEVFDWAGGARTFTTDGDYQVLIVLSEGAGDTTPPSRVTGVDGSAIHDARVELQWDAASDGESGISGYRVYRDGVLIGEPTGTLFADTDTAAETSYSYTVAALNGVGLEGPASEAAVITTPVFDAPPSISLTAPVDESVHPPEALTLQASASDDNGVSAVEFLVITQSGGLDEVLRVTDDDGSDGWSVVWSDPAIDDYDVSATAIDTVGKRTESASVVLHVRDPLSLSLAADPVSGEAPLTVQCNATATGGDGGGAVPEILWWELDAGDGSTAADSSDAGHAGVIDGATWTTGRDGPCLEFAGDGGQIVDEDAEDFLNGLDAVSVALWIKSDDLGTDQGFFTCRSPNGSDEGLSLRYDASGADGGGDDVIKVGLSTSGGGTAFESAAGVQTTAWQHLCLTWQSGSAITLYVNGVATTPTAAGSSPSGTLSGLSTLIVGRGPKDSSGGWDGLIDDVRIYDRALSAEEVDDVANGAGSYSFAWDFDNDGVTDSEAIDPAHTFTADGVYPVTCTVTDALGSTVSDTVTITVGAASVRTIIMDLLDGWEWECAPAPGSDVIDETRQTFDGLDAGADHQLSAVAAGAG